MIFSRDIDLKESEAESAEQNFSLNIRCDYSRLME